MNRGRPRRSMTPRHLGPVLLGKSYSEKLVAEPERGGWGVHTGWSPAGPKAQTAALRLKTWHWFLTAHIFQAEFWQNLKAGRGEHRRPLQPLYVEEPTSANCMLQRMGLREGGPPVWWLFSGRSDPPASSVLLPPASFCLPSCLLCSVFFCSLF